MIALALAELVELVWVAPLAALAVTVTFSACVLGATRSSDARRDGGGSGAAWLALSVLAGLGVLASGLLYRAVRLHRAGRR